jgi:nitric oxide reductase subunit B
MGMVQLLAAIENGYWHARSELFMQQPILELPVWMRVPGDTIFSIGASALSWFVLNLRLRPRRKPHGVEAEADANAAEAREAVAA